MFARIKRSPAMLPEAGLHEPDNFDALDGDVQRRVTQLLHDHHRFIWRCVRRFGVEVAAVDDVVQEVFIVLTRRLSEVTLGKERAFLTQTAFRLAANWRRGGKRRPPMRDLMEEQVASDQDSPEVLVEQQRTRRRLDLALDLLSDEHRAVLVLSEVDGLTRVEIAELLGLPAGTVASRLKAAKTKFASEVSRLWTEGSIEEL